MEDRLPDEWITAFEFRQLGQDSPYHREFVTQTHVRSALLSPEATSEVRAFGSELWEEEVGTHHPAENLTWEQFREALRDGHHLEPPDDGPCVPFASYRQRHAGFLGFHTIASLSSSIIRDQELTLDGFSVFADGKQIARFEAWQEGFPDEDYNDESLSFGVRLRVRTDFVEKLCRDSDRAFATRTVENRFVMKDYEQNPEESCSSVSIHVWPGLASGN
jgi:hypothetical protein